MEINVVGRHMDVPDRFRRHLTDKLDKVTQLAPETLRVDVEVSQEKNPRQAELSDRVELTVHEKGSVIRAEARADDLYGALDIAYGKLLERLRRARDRRKDHRRGRDRAHQGSGASLRTMPADQELPAALQEDRPESGAESTDAPEGDEIDLADAGSPVASRIASRSPSDHWRVSATVAPRSSGGSRNASSTDTCSTTGTRSASTSNMRRLSSL